MIFKSIRLLSDKSDFWWIGDFVIVRNGATDDSDYFVDDDWIFNAACKKFLLLRLEF